MVKKIELSPLSQTAVIVELPGSNDRAFPAMARVQKT